MASISDDDIINAALSPEEVEGDAGRVRARALQDLIAARGVTARRGGWNPWGGAQARVVPPAALGPHPSGDIGAESF